MTLRVPPGQGAGVNGDGDAELSFEAALKRLEEIVRKLEAGDEPLDRAIDLYAEGDRLKAFCEERLRSAQARIDAIVAGADGQVLGQRLFDSGRPDGA